MSGDVREVFVNFQRALLIPASYLGLDISIKHKMNLECSFNNLLFSWKQVFRKA